MARCHPWLQGKDTRGLSVPVGSSPAQSQARGQSITRGHTEPQPSPGRKVKSMGIEKAWKILFPDDQEGPTVEHRELCSMLCGSLDGGESGGEWIHVYVWLGPCARETITTLFIGYTPI